jgi:hypothetical protein
VFIAIYAEFSLSVFGFIVNLSTIYAGFVPSLYPLQCMRRYNIEGLAYNAKKTDHRG